MSGGEVAAALDEAPIIGSILERNIYGVDINPASVEIAKLALWLHSARADAPLSRLDRTLRCGNSLVGSDFWTGRPEDAELRERVNAFDWRPAFPEVWPDGEPGGFDIVLGNPPYVKLQNLMKVDPQVVAYIQDERGDDTYRSARTGNFDLYLPFIEKGLRILAPGGRMAYIAPSLWAVNDYGRGLRGLVRERRQLERWTDFRSHQIFDEAITYTALQVFSKEPGEVVRMALAPDGERDVADIDWTDADLAVPYEALSADREWLIATGAERRLIDRLAEDCVRLGDRAVADEIFQGVKTGADPIFKLERVADGTYSCGAVTPSALVEIEPAIMHPILSGPEAKRYFEPQTDTFLLFPYDGRGRLLQQDEFQRQFPKAWAYLERWKDELIKRDGGKLDDDEWYRFSRAQSLDKGGKAKLVAAGTVPSLRFSADPTGAYFLTGGRVDGVVAAAGADLWTLLGTLNGPVADFVFRRLGRPKMGGWFEANKQFIAPLPVPAFDAKGQAEVARRARDLQTAWTARRDLLRAAEARLGALAKSRHGPAWLWPSLPPRDDLIDQAPAALTARGDRVRWAGERFGDLMAVEIARLQASLDGGARLTAAFADGELRLFAGGATILGRIYLDDGPGGMAQAYWRYLLLSQTWRDAEAFSGKLRLPPAEHDTPAARQFIDRVQALGEQTAAIETAENEMNALLYDLYGLSDEERELVENERLRRGVA